MARKRVLLTGASRGIGMAIAELLEAEDAYELVTPTRQHMDLSDLESVAAYMASAGEFDVLINNAGITAGEISDEGLMTKMMINLISPIKLCRCVIEGMTKNQWGRIVNISSVAGMRGHPTDPVYSATKFGINGFTQSMSKQLGQYNILINSICPGATETDGLRARAAEYDPDKMAAQKVPLGRIAAPAEIATAVSFLISEHNSYITGAILPVDGGLTAVI